jgi:DNA-binding GntR family transcriptional regulator
VPLQIVVDTDSPTPPYEQVRAQLADLIEHGVMTVDERRRSDSWPPTSGSPPERSLVLTGN